MKIAVVGSGISGLTSAWMLAHQHEVTLFEAAPRPGGHTHTVRVNAGPQGSEISVDTGFIVFNRRTYPLFCRLLHKLEVPAQDSDMGFSVQMERNGVEYCGDGFGGLFAQRKNLLRPNHWRMLRDILRFYKESPELLQQDSLLSLGAYLQQNGYSKVFLDEHLVPMAAAVWSADPAMILEFPARTLVQFFQNHGFLDLKNRPQWRTVQGGSKTYVDALLKDFCGELRLGTPVIQVLRQAVGVLLQTLDGQSETFDQVVLATHGDLSLKMLAQPTPREEQVLSAFSFQANDVVLHQDASLMPKGKRSWSAWNYFVPASERPRATVTYWMNKLQNLSSPLPLLVTLNRTQDIDPDLILGQYEYDHPVFDEAAIRAQEQHQEISGTDRIHYCGAYWRYGFHEDGVWSAVRVAKSFGVGEEVFG